MINRIAVFVTALLLSFAVQASQPGSQPSELQAVGQGSTIHAFTQELQLEGDCPVVQEMSSDELILAQGCCKVCRKGKACGDSCISRNYTC
ncbi:hypothetical protein, partial [Halomonas sp. BBD45]